MEMLMCSYLAGMGTSTFSVFDDKKKGQLAGCDRFNARDLSQREPPRCSATVAHSISWSFSLNF